MATKRKTATRRRTTAVAKSAPRRRRMNAARPAARRRRRMNSATGMQADVMNVGMLVLGAVGGQVVVGLAAKLTDNYYVRAGSVAVGGLLLARMAPKAKFVGYGMAVAGGAGMALKALEGTGILAGAMNGTRSGLSPSDRAAITKRLKDAAERVNGRTPNTLVGRQPATLVGYDWNGNPNT